MPYANSIKSLEKDNIYHLYARGINKNDIFKEASDYLFFKYLFKKYLSKNFKEKRKIGGKILYFPVNSVSEEVELYCYCLMKNHFHLIVKNKSLKGISHLMLRVLSNYATYFNKKYKREGPVIQGSYRAVNIMSDDLLIYIARYIHLNPYKAKIVSQVRDYKYSSYENYLYNKSTSWLKIEDIILKSTNWSIIERYSDTIQENPKTGILLY